jgi:hypothetical protein
MSVSLNLYNVCEFFSLEIGISVSFQFPILNV